MQDERSSQGSSSARPAGRPDGAIGELVHAVTLLVEAANDSSTARLTEAIAELIAVQHASDDMQRRFLTSQRELVAAQRELLAYQRELVAYQRELAAAAARMPPAPPWVTQPASASSGLPATPPPIPEVAADEPLIRPTPDAEPDAPPGAGDVDSERSEPSESGTGVLGATPMRAPWPWQGGDQE